MPRRFSNPWPEPPRGLREVLRWKLGCGERVIPTFPDARAPAAVTYLTSKQLATIPDDGWQVTWLGHASFLLSGCGVHLLIDPIFSDYCAPLPWPSFKRHAPPPCGIADLPPIAAVLLTHTHYDHCDLPTLRRLGRTLPLIVPAGHRRWFRRKGFPEVTELAWWEQTRITTEIVVTATPARHFTARTPWDRNRGHWCGFHLTGGGASLRPDPCREDESHSCTSVKPGEHVWSRAECPDHRWRGHFARCHLQQGLSGLPRGSGCLSLWHSGDSGYGPAFREIGERLGPVDFGMIAIGAYEPRWFMHPLHMNPAEAVLAFQETRCREAVGMHWGTFSLSDEPLGEPPLLLAAAVREQNLPPTCFTTAAIGHQWRILKDSP